MNNARICTVRSSVSVKNAMRAGIGTSRPEVPVRVRVLEASASQYQCTPIFSASQSSVFGAERQQEMDSSMRELREVELDGQRLYTCPNGCDESELETGTEGQSFMAIMGKPHRYLRCGKCGFGEDNRQHPKVEMTDVIATWNATCELALKTDD